MGNKVTYGFKKVHIAFLNSASQTPPEWEAPTEIPGAVRFTPTAQGQENTFYADDSPYFVVTANNGYTAELEMALVPDAILARMLGWETDTNGMLVEIADAIPEPFALLGEVTGDAKNRRFAYYNCIASRPAKEHSTKNESITPSTDIINVTITPIEISGKTIVKGVMELSDTNTVAYNAFFTAVPMPTFGGA